MSPPPPTPPRRRRVLLIAEAANPEWVSVPLVGWSHCRALADVVDSHLVTQVRNRDAILRAGLAEGDDFTAIDSEALAKPLYKLASWMRGGEGKGWTAVTALAAPSHAYFEHLLWKRLGGRLRAGEFDLVHRVTPLSPTTPSPLAARCRRLGVPFVVGPLNGGLPWPPGFDAERRREREWLSYVRSAYRLVPGYGATRRHASALVIGSVATWKQMPPWALDRCVYVPENGIDPKRFTTTVDRPVERPLRVAFVGRLVPYKGADMLIEAAAPLVRAGAVRIDVLGDGPELERLTALVAREGLESGVDLAGWVDHRELQHRLVQSDVLGFPSVREFGGGVVLEAMALGLAPLVVDYGGPAELVTPTTGWRVPLGRRDAIVAGVRAALERLAARPESVRPTGRRARRRVLSTFTWEAKARQTLEVYRWVLGETPRRPDFGMPLPDGAGAGPETHAPPSAAPPP